MKRRKWWVVAAILWMAVIFTFTQVPYSTGENTSDGIQKLLVFLHINGLDHAAVDQLNFLVRKLTHITVFGFLAFLLFKSLEAYRFAYIFSWILTVVYAMTDEYHQSFMPGRTASIKDVFLFDGVGAFLVLLLTYFIVRINKRRRTGASVE
ncbi:VanZ family protein [Neobacillus cucumis]|uniref:VanZ family protein n=1 Tax=Neobacillus cucumis TaxID=1740721 RepID=A0A2N5HFJ7_9BACI|nr:VanZ family protein [Neobacillus cucumis]PLS04277.1 VanZ family protein [Neobacillus cucumis]